MRLGTNPTAQRRHVAAGFSLLAGEPSLLLGLVYLQVLLVLLAGLALGAVVKLAWRIGVMVFKAVRSAIQLARRRS